MQHLSVLKHLFVGGRLAVGQDDECFLYLWLLFRLELKCMNY